MYFIFLTFRKAPIEPVTAHAGRDTFTSMAFMAAGLGAARVPGGSPRHAAAVLGNPSLRSGLTALADDIDVLTRALDDDEPLVREHAAWALRRIGSPGAIAALRERLLEEGDAGVRAELRAALADRGD